MPAASQAVESRRALSMRMAAARKQTDRLFSMVGPDSMYERPIPERHRIIFYRGHLEAFDWNLLQPRLAGLNHFDPLFDQLFAFGIDPVDGGLPSDRAADWPAESQVERYCARIRTALDKALAGERSSIWAGEESPATLLNVAIEHRLMHAETLAYMLHQLSPERKSPPTQVPVPEAGPLETAMVEIPAGSATLGIARKDTASFGWDNEYEAQVVNVPAFTMDRYKVTNGQYLEFLRAGGYQERSLWAEPDWNWRTQQSVTHPVFWRAAQDGWRYRTMFDEIPLPLDWPVYVSHAEASAYARWANQRLPTEAEWQRASCGTPEGTERPFPWGADAPGPSHGYVDFERWDPAPVSAFPCGRSAFGVSGMLANGWEWTASVFEPFAGFRPFPFYEGYSANFFDGMHYVMKGGSTRTGQCMLRRSFRNWFQPHYQYVYAGFRCARS